MGSFSSFSGLIVAGGLGRRLGGAEKAMLTVGGRTIADRTVAVLQRTCAEVLVATPRPLPWSGAAVRIVLDELEEAGPLGGLASGLAASRRPWLLVVAGDMPLLDERLLRFLMARALATGRTVLPRLGGHPQPLHAAYRSADAVRALAALAAGTRKVTGWLEPEEVEWVDVETLRGMPQAEQSFLGINTPAELDAARRILDARACDGHTHRA